MYRVKIGRSLVIAAMAAVLIMSGFAEARAHCDGLDGPVVKAAKRLSRTAM
jgi:hypothetical protein